MKRSRFFVFGAVLVLGVIAAGIFWGFYSIPPIEEQVPNSPVMVQLVTPLNGKIFEGGASVPIQVQAYSPNDVTKVEVWADGQLLNSEAISAQFPDAAISNFDWVSGTAGVHVLMARAVDAAGFTGQSSLALVTIKISTPMEEYTASEGDTLAGIADFLGVDPQAVNDANPELDPEGGLPEGTQIKLPIPEPAPPTPPIEPPQFQGTAQEPAPTLNPIVYKLAQLVNFGKSDPLPTPPLLYGTLENCNQVKLTIVPQSDNEDGYFVYRYVFNPQAPLVFENIAVLGLGGASMQPMVYTETMPGVAAFYYVSAFNMTGEVSSAPVSITLGLNDCASGGDKTPVPFDFMGNFEASVPVSRAYCYYSTQEGDWKRFPSQEFDFFTPGDVFLEPLMFAKVPPNPVLQMECWGWDGPTLQFLGSGEAMVSTEPVTVVGTNFAFDLPPMKTLGGSFGEPDDNQGVVNDAYLNLANKQVPPPINVREVEEGSICAEHFEGMYPGNCDEIIHKQVKQEYILIWDWKEKTCWGPSSDCPWMTDFQFIGFNVYQDGNPNPIAVVYDKGAMIPLPWGYACYKVTAFTETVFGVKESKPTDLYCPNLKNPPQEMVLQATHLLTQGKQSLYQCPYPPSNPASGLQSNQVLVGIVDTPCWDMRYQGEVMFDLDPLKLYLGGVSLQDAMLRFKKGSSYVQSASSGYEFVINEYPLCGVEVGLLFGTGWWTDWDPSSALNGGYSLLGIGNPRKALPEFAGATVEVDVTDLLVYMYYNGGINSGFGFSTNIDTLYNWQYYAPWHDNNICYNRLQDFELVVHYYPLGQ